MSAREDAISPDELRKKLYKTLRDRGVLDTLKTHLRNQLIHELKPAPLNGAESAVRANSHFMSACNSIVADYLRSSGYDYSYSVFCPESGLCKEKVFNKGDLLQVLKIDPESPLYKSLSLSIDNTGFLMNLVSYITDRQNVCQHRDADTQTVSSASYEQSLVEKMKMIDKEYENVNYSGEKWFSFQSKLASYKRELESQMQTEMNTKLQHFKEVEVTKVKMEEKVQFQKEFDKLKQELEKSYEMKMKVLNTREKHTIERLQKQQEIEEKNVYMQRQMVLKEIDTLRNRENELKLRMESFEETCQIQEEKVKTGEEMLRRRELAVKTMEDMYDQKLKNEISRYQMELKEDYNKRTELLTASENQNKENIIRIQNDTATLKARLEEYNEACSERKRLQLDVDAAQQQTCLLRQQNELLRERLESMNDFPALKEDNVRLRGQVMLLKKQLEEAQEENRRLNAELRKPSDEQLALQAELLKLQSACKLQEEEFAKQQNALQKQLQFEVERCSQLNVQLKECEEKQQWMNTLVEDLKMQLRQTQQALENEVLLNPKPSLVDRSVLDFSNDGLVSHNIYLDRAALRPLPAYEPVGDIGRLVTSDSSSDSKSLAEFQARMREMEKEADVLAEEYKKHQQRAARANVSRRRPTPSSRGASPLLTLTSDLPYAAHLSKSLTQALSPNKARTPSPVSFPAARHKVTYQDPLHKSYGTSSLSSAELQGQQSFTHLSFRTKKKHCKDSTEGVNSSHLAEVDLSPWLQSHDSRLSLAPRRDASSSGELSPELSPPRSPQLKSTARESRRAPSRQRVSSSSHSSPQPERINVEDLAGISPEPGHIPELLPDTAVPLSSSEAPGGPSVPCPQDSPGRAEASEILTSSADEEKGDEGQRWEKQRKEKQDLRRREQEEARAREQKETERLEKESLLQQQQQSEEEDIKGDGDKRQEAEVPKENSLEKYMKMVLEAREKKQDKSAGSENHMSPEVKSLSEEKDNSIAAYSHKDDSADDNFW
ncbi:centriole and centriolar satellite protein ofd1-like isoform X1 [Corythoichthys intestinalis]|uniref:centriole and centriolar satellite protein ofd1-like isoform X1 n=1 Tax=Corythoichthys intestinalis TaxID=161448 RepID=UPI0025A61683|nr:centriole and centriolar satellite protein ofd1-like isoform X1 [Corythoichthys intestinalis]